MAGIKNVNYISPEDSKIQYVKEETAPKNELNKDAFLNLLVTQLRYQDPLNPTNDKEFLAQMAQFTSLEQMQNMNQNLETTKAFSLIGKEVQATVVNPQTSDTEIIQGKVEFVKMANSKAYLIIGNREVPVEDVDMVTDSVLLGIDNQPGNAFELIGKVVQVTRKNPNINELEYIEGKVNHINMKNGVAYLVIGSSEFFIESSMEDLTGVVEKESITGKIVLANYYNNETEEYEEIEGKIDYISIRNNKMYVVVNGKEISYEDIIQVYED